MPGESLGPLVGRQVGRQPCSPQAAGAGGLGGAAALSSGAHAFPLRISKPEKSELLTGGVRNVTGGDMAANGSTSYQCC